MYTRNVSLDQPRDLHNSSCVLPSRSFNILLLASTDSLRLGDWEPSAHTKGKKNVKRLKKIRNCKEERLSFSTIQFWSTTSSDNFKGWTQRPQVVKNAGREISTHRKSWPWTVESQSRRFSRHLRRSSLLWTICGNVRARTIWHQTAPPIRITALALIKTDIPTYRKLRIVRWWDFSASYPNDAVRFSTDSEKFSGSYRLTLSSDILPRSCRGTFHIRTYMRGFSSLLRTLTKSV